MHSLLEAAKDGDHLRHEVCRAREMPNVQGAGVIAAGLRLGQGQRFFPAGAAVDVHGHAGAARVDGVVVYLRLVPLVRAICPCTLAASQASGQE